MRVTYIDPEFERIVWEFFAARRARLDLLYGPCWRCEGMGV